jgi:hypothetical protein
VFSVDGEFTEARFTGVDQSEKRSDATASSASSAGVAGSLKPVSDPHAMVRTSRGNAHPTKQFNVFMQYLGRV